MSNKSDKKFKTREEILGVQDLKTEEVFVDSWDCYVRVRTLPGTERELWEQKMIKQRDSGVMDNIRASLVALTLVDEAGALMFPGEEGVAELGRKSAKALDAIFAAAQRINKLTEKDVKELEGN